MDKSTGERQRQYLRQRKVAVTVCQTGCTSHKPKSINHVKLFLLGPKEVDQPVPVAKQVIVTSSNLTYPDRRKRYNNSVRSVADDELYDYYFNYWTRLDNKDWAGWGNTQRETRTKQGNDAWVFPRRKPIDGDPPVRDPVVRLLKSVACTPQHNKVWVAMALFTRGRPKVQQQLQRLNKDCDVQVVVGRNVPTDNAGRGLKEGAVRRACIHHKVLILDAMIGGQPRKVVYTGSHNFTGRALTRSDEIWTGYGAPFVFDAFVVYYKQLRELPSRPAETVCGRTHPPRILGASARHGQHAASAPPTTRVRMPRAGRPKVVSRLRSGSSPPYRNQPVEDTAAA